MSPAMQARDGGLCSLGVWLPLMLIFTYFGGATSNPLWSWLHVRFVPFFLPSLSVDKQTLLQLVVTFTQSKVLNGRCPLRARCDLWCSSSLSTPCLYPSGGDQAALAGYYSSVRSIAGMSLVEYLAVHVLNFVYASSSCSSTCSSWNS